MTPIGYIQTPFKERFGTPRQPSLVPSSWGTLTLGKEFSNLQGSFEGLEGFSHVWLIFAFHQNENKAVRAKIHPPRMEGEKMGLFATRTPHRPNPIGLSAVKLERVEGNTLHFSGVDLVDGTPILDIKPYLPSSDSIPDARSGWTNSREERTIEVAFTSDARGQLEASVRDKADRFQAAITEILSLDPRPVFYRGTTENPNPYTDVYGFRFDDLNVVYRMAGNRAEVFAIEAWDERNRLK
ncbi:MAG TPA: tRNA (N6-threonylcarbamoyladenosine(37)-N6)-methyltransferase TrmO [Bdellovibrionales bacterium]|nr:tRNA (N6-threonylcarbamoyladenosine(37)-N6)-methyltransferase TrmO [Bdellovibrionales bacterium]